MAKKKETTKSEVKTEAKETQVKEAPNKSKSIIDDLPEGHEFKQIGNDAVLTYGNKRIRVTGKLEDKKEHLARVFLNGK